MTWMIWDTPYDFGNPHLYIYIYINNKLQYTYIDIYIYIYILYVYIYIYTLCIFESLRDENRLHPENRTERKEAGLLGPTKSRLESNLAVLGLKLGRIGACLRPTWAQLEWVSVIFSDHCFIMNGRDGLARALLLLMSQVAATLWRLQL